MRQVSHLYNSSRGFIFTCRARDHANKSFLALQRESSYFYFSQLEAGQKRKRWQREWECESVCVRVRACMRARDAEGGFEYGDYADGKWVTLLGVDSRPVYGWGNHRQQAKTQPGDSEETLTALQRNKCIINVCPCINDVYFTVQYVLMGHLISRVNVCWRLCNVLPLYGSVVLAYVGVCMWRLMCYLEFVCWEWQ